MVAVGKTEVPAKYLPTLLAAAAKYGVPPAFLAAQINAESSFNADAVSPDGAIGISQFMPSTAKSLGIDPKDPEQSINAMAKLMAHYRKEYGSWEKALYAYHGGPGARDDPGPAGREYARKILGIVGEAVNDVGGVVDGVTSPFKATEKLFSRFSDRDAWLRFGRWSIGSGLLVLGFLFVLWSYNSGAVKQVAGVRK